MSTVTLQSLYLIREASDFSYSNQSSVLLLNKFQALSYKECEHFWSYAGKLILLSRNLLNAAARSSPIIFLAGTDFPHKIKTVVTQLKLLSIVSVPFSLVDLKSTSQKIFSSLLINDKEGFAMGTLSFSMITADAFDSVSTFVNSLLLVIGSHPIEVLSSLGLPVGFLIAGVGTVSRTIRIAKAFNLYKNIHPAIFIENKAAFKKHLEESLGIADIELLLSKMNQSDLEQLEKLKEKKKAIISRMIPEGAAEDFERLFSSLSNQEFEEVFENLENIRSHLEKKMNAELIGILANLIVISALVLFSMGTITPLPFLLMALAFTVRIGSLIYQEHIKKDFS